MSIIGFVDTGGKVVTALVGDRLPCSRILVIPIVCLLNSAVTFMLTLTMRMTAIIVYAVIVGIGRAILYSILYASSVETFGHHLYEESFAIILLMNGLGCLVAPVIPGLSFDLTGSYDAANYCFTILWLLCCALFLAVYFRKNHRNRKQYLATQADLHDVIEQDAEACDKQEKGCHIGKENNKEPENEAGSANSPIFAAVEACSLLDGVKDENMVESRQPKPDEPDPDPDSRRDGDHDGDGNTFPKCIIVDIVSVV